MSGVRRVIVGASGSPGSLPALRYAEHIARRDDAPLIAVHAWTPPGGDLADRSYPSLYLRRVWTQAAKDRLRRAFLSAWGCIPAGLEIQPIVIRGQPGPALTEIACSSADVLVIGTGRRGRLARIWHGQVSRYCVMHALCPVIVVPPAAVGRGPGLPRWPWWRREVTDDQARDAS